jgi:hypothetical protein
LCCVDTEWWVFSQDFLLVEVAIEEPKVPL